MSGEWPLWSSALLVVAGCGRIGFGVSAPEFDAPQDADGAGPTDAADVANLVFVTSAAFAPVTLESDLSGGDQFCASAATAAGLPGTYVAWLSTSTVDAADRLGAARGWRRLDGRPFADTSTDIASARAWYPILLDETGTAFVGRVTIGSTPSGRLDTGLNCSDFTSVTGNVAYGHSHGAGGEFSRAENLTTCGGMFPIYCFGIDRSVAVSPPPAETGLVVFAVPNWIPSGGILGADSACTDAALAAGVPGGFRALLSTTTASAASRFAPELLTPVVRIDGIRVAVSTTALFDSLLDAAPNVTAQGVHVFGTGWAGAPTPRMITTMGSCLDWTDASFAMSGQLGWPATAGVGYFGRQWDGFGSASTCSTPRSLLCLQSS